MGRKPLDYGRALRQLRVDPALTVERVIADTADELVVEDSDGLDLQRVLVDVLARVMPEERWLPLLAAVAEADYTHERMAIGDGLPRALGARLARPAIAALETMPAFALRRLEVLLQDEHVDAEALRDAWPIVLALVEDDDRDIAAAAAFLAIRGPRITPAVVSVLASVLAGLLDEMDPDAYDDQVGVEEALGAIANAGARHPALGDLAPALVPFLHFDAMAWRTAATVAAIGIDARVLRGDIEEALARMTESSTDLGARVERTIHLYGVWLFGGATDALARATAVAKDSVVAMFRLRQAFERSRVDERLLSALRGVADDLAWTPSICDVFAAFGPRAAQVLATIPPPLVEDEAYTPWVIARYRCGLATRSETRIALEANLAWHAWALYVELAVDDPIAEQRLRDELARPAGEHEVPFAVPLAANPTLLERLVLDLSRGGYEALLYAAARSGAIRYG